MKLAFILTATATCVICFATYSNGLAVLGFIATITTGILAIRKGH